MKVRWGLLKHKNPCPRKFTYTQGGRRAGWRKMAFKALSAPTDSNQAELNETV